MTLVLDGKKIAETIYHRLRPSVAQLKKKGIVPCLAVVLVNSNPESRIFVEQKVKEGKKLGVLVRVFRLSKKVAPATIERTIARLNKDEEIDGIVIQLPLPSHLDTDRILNLVKKKKDVDGLTKNSPYPSPCATGILRILDFYKIDFKNQKVVIVGKGRLVGRPLLRLFQMRGVKAMAVHPFASNFKTVLAQADLIIGGASKKGIILPQMVKKNAIVIDAAKNCHPDVKMKVKAMTPSLGGVGPVTVATLLENVIYSACRRAKMSPINS